MVVMDDRLRSGVSARGVHFFGTRASGRAGALTAPRKIRGSRVGAIILGVVLVVGVAALALSFIGPRIDAETIKALDTSTTGTTVDCDRASSSRRGSFGGRYRAVWEYEVDGTTYRYRDAINRMQSGTCTDLLTRTATATIFYDPAEPDRAARGDVLS